MDHSITNLSQILNDTLEKRCQRNPNYSLRAFARDLGVSASRLSRWLGGKDGVSKEASILIAKKIGMNEEETKLFLLAMESKYARSKRVKEIATKKLLSMEQKYSHLNDESFKIISDWYHFAILSLLEIIPRRVELKWIAKKLGISVYEVKGSIEKLKVQGLILDDEGSLSPTGVFFANASGLPSKSVRAFHQQVLDKAKIAIDFQPVEERDFSTLILAVDSSQVVEAKAFIKKFRDDFESRFCNSAKSKNEVYALGIQYFSLSQKITEGVIK